MKPMSLIKRALLALLATLIGIGIGTAVNLALVIVADHKTAPPLKEFLVSYVQFLGATVFAGYPGWLAGFVVLVPFADPRGWRFWMWLGVGTLIGIIAVFLSMGGPRAGLIQSGFAMFYVWAAVDASLTSLIFLLLVRRLRCDLLFASGRVTSN